MDFLDPKKQRQHKIRLTVGYVLLAIALLLTVRVLLYVAVGYGVGKNGQIIQNGLIFVSSTPGGAQIYVDGTLKSARTNARLQLPSGEYTFKITRSGYRPWQRAIVVDGGKVERFDYPFLFPTTLTTSDVQAYQAAPGLATQSPDHHWLLVEQTTNINHFDEFDLTNPTAAPTVLTIPSTAYTAATGTQSWQLVEWSTDNQHVLLKHLYNQTYEYILLNRSDPTQSVNLTRTLGVNPTKISLRDKKYDQYYAYFADSGNLETASLSNPTPAADLANVLTYKSYGANDMLYVTTDGAPAGKVMFKMLLDGKTYDLRAAPAQDTYLLDWAQYDGDWYVAIGASSENKLYVYKNPADQLAASPAILVPVQIMKVAHPTYLSFSSDARFIVEESGTTFAVYDNRYGGTYTYTVNESLDAPQTHATWMDGAHLEYVSGGQLIVFDYDHANMQKLQTASPDYTPFFAPDYSFVDVLAPAKSVPTDRVLTSTSLLAQ